MKSMYRGLAVAVLQCALVLTVAGKYTYDRAHLPRVWAHVAPIDPNLPIRGRYLRLRAEVEAPASAQGYLTVRLAEVDHRLTATEDAAGTVHITARPLSGKWTLVEPLAFYLPEHAQDPSRLQPGEELWVEVSVPVKGLPRPIRLGVKRNGVLEPLGLR
ncbi:MAG TPA: hypothetical protein VMI94_14310 [Bryobacteraceae bacterium]|nr:hypothetical protein [Bryobacteraceae bacterium]